MTALVFVDANVFVYARDPREPRKHAAAREWISRLWDEQRGRTSSQALSEFYAVVTRKLRIPVPRDEAWDEVQAYFAWNPHPIDTEILTRAREIEGNLRLAWWDCLIVAAAQAQNCVLLLSEAMQDGADYGGLRVRNPFTLAVSDESGAYTLPPPVASRHRGRGRPRRNPQTAAG